MPKRIVDAATRVVALFAAATIAGAAGLDLPGTEPKLLPPEQAFRFSARALDANTLEARFDVANGYYLYRDKLHFGLEKSSPTLGAATFPSGQRKHDAFFGEVEIYRGAVTVKLPMAGAAPRQDIVLVAESQGCADIGVCYPPSRQQVRLVMPAPGAGAGPQVEAVQPRKGLFD
ncbi:MAG TPA: protein-disulfide reductase DsbD N-terminal domain-containing protein [Casimicrobiaceae bacterium]|jgi:thiol:disulfide interchange protein DsbD